jgi:pyruvate,orthophosphate dikinase
MANQTKYVYFFGGGKAEGKSQMKDILGGKGANLAEMTNLGIPVPPGFSISTEVCTYYYQNKNTYPPGLRSDVEAALRKMEKLLERRFGDPDNPLLVSVRSGGRASMPGMMDTILNLGLNRLAIKGLTKKSGNRRFVLDSYRRFIQMYGEVVMGVKSDVLEEILTNLKKEKGKAKDTDLTAEDLEILIDRLRTAVEKESGRSFPDNPDDQLWGAIGAVFGSWQNPRAITYRALNKIPDEWGTAVNVQSMVFGNLGDSSATGVAFTRNPATGEKLFYGEFLPNAQGEDVVAGIRTPQPITRAQKQPQDAESLDELMPQAFQELEGVYQKLEKHYRDMQDIEFTIEDGRLWMLQTRRGKRTAGAAVRIAVEMVDEGLIKPEEAVARVTPDQLSHFLHPAFDPKEKKDVLAKGLPASPGAAVGMVVFNAEDAEQWAKDKKDVILVRVETSPDDIHGMNAAQGILTARGGMTSHAAVVARGMGKCAVVGCGALEIDYEKGLFRVGDRVIKQGDFISLNGSTGEIIMGKLKKTDPDLSSPEFARFMKIVDKVRTLGVRTNADTPRDCRKARELGAEGIGLCRTEHMFFAPDRIPAVREMIMAEDEAGRRVALKKILPMQRGDFVEIFRVMEGLPVTIRLLDPPLHEFLPNTEAEIQELVQTSGIPAERLKTKLLALHEANPMLGHRGCRLGITFPDMYEMQVQAIAEAAAQLIRDEKLDVRPEIMIPLVGDWKELKILRDLTKQTVEKVQEEMGTKFDYLIGTMIELPRAALTADQIAEYAEFFSFGTNDLTQTTWGLSRDDAGKFLGAYLKAGIFKVDPFASLDQEGVGQLIKMGVEKGRKVRPKLKVGICGEHGGDPASVIFCHGAGLTYVSCSPFRVPIARLSAARAAIGAGTGEGD